MLNRRSRSHGPNGQSQSRFHSLAPAKHSALAVAVRHRRVFLRDAGIRLLEQVWRVLRPFRTDHISNRQHGRPTEAIARRVGEQCRRI